MAEAEEVHVDAGYRVFVRSRHLIQIGGASGEPETSNILAFQILERDPSREAGVAERVAHVLDNPASREAPRAALSELSILGTRQAGALLARELRKDRRNDEVIIRGLYTVDDRSSAVQALERELQKPDRPVDAALVRELAMLELARRHPAGPPYSHAEYLATIRKYSARRARALHAQPRRLQAEIARELGDHQSNVTDWPWSGSYFLAGVLAPAMYQFPAETTAAFLTLGSEQQYGLLIASWPRFAHVRFLPLLRTLYTSSQDEAVRGAALRRLTDLAPSEGRTAIMAELRRRLPRVPTAALLQLRDRTLPALERIWVNQLERATTDEHRASVAQRIQRYGTAWSGPRVARFYARNHRTLSSAAKAPILAHLSRVDPAALPDLREALSFWPDRHVDETLLEQVADLEWQPVTERATIEALYGSDPGEVERAARVLSRHGTPQAREPVHARLRLSQAVLRREWTARPGSPLDGSPEWDLEERLAEALAHARGWLLADAAAAAEAAQCVNPRCSSAFERNRYADPDIEILAYGPVPGDEHHDRFLIGPTDYDSIEALERKLTQFAPGTRVFWGYRLRWSFEDSLERWTWPQRNALFERVRASAARHGVTIQRERTYKRP